MNKPRLLGAVCAVALVVMANTALAGMDFNFSDNGDGRTLITASGSATLVGIDAGGARNKLVGWDDIYPVGVDDSRDLVADSDFFSFNASTLPGGWQGPKAAVLGAEPLNINGIPLGTSLGLGIDGSSAPGPFFALFFSDILPNTGTVVASGSAVAEIPFSDLPYSAGSVVDLMGTGEILFTFGVVAVVDTDGDGVSDGADNCPTVSNPLQGNNDDDDLGDVCDPDDDNDGTDDVADNCPINGNADQADLDYDGLGDACDTTIDAGSIAQHVENEVAGLVLTISAINVSGGNGMISKLTGNGGVIKKMSSAITAFNGGYIDVATYLSELEGALSKLDAFDNQIAAKISNGKIVDPDATAILDASAEIRTTIDNLKVAAGG